tara:strand:- start:7140 stop:7772 length:633 start_codon:yes stop_codon:yes gene_type:complete
MINDQHNFLAIFPPKTASTSVRRVLNLTEPVVISGEKMASVHIPCTEWLNVMIKDGIDPSSYFKFMFVRNPWSRIVSQWEYMRRMQRRDTSYGAACKRIVGIVKNFKGFLTINVSDLYGTGSDEHLLEPCYNYGYDSHGNQLVDFVGKFENLQQDFNTVCHSIGLSQRLVPHINISKYKHYTKYYDEDTKQVVANRYAKDIDYFKYTFKQ